MVDIIVVDLGSGVIKAGFAGDEAPRVVFPSIVGRANGRSHRPVDGWRLGDDDPLVGNQAQKRRGLLRLSYPIEHGIVTRWDDMERIWRHLYLNVGVDPSKHPIVWTEPPLNPKGNRERMTQVLFETFNVAALSVACKAVVSLYSTGGITGVIVASGHSLSYTVPVYEGFAIHHAISRARLGGHHITEFLQNLLNERGYRFTTTAETEIVRDLKEKLAYVALDCDTEIEKSRRSSNSQESYELPDGNMVFVNHERFQCVEVLFRPYLCGLEEMGIGEMTFQSIMKSEPGARPELYGNVVLSGGTTKFLGMAQRLGKELRALAPSTAHIQVRTSPRYSAWQGASLYAEALASHGNLQNDFMSSSEYDSLGCTGVHRLCFGFQESEKAKRRAQPQQLLTPTLANASPELRDFLMRDEVETLPEVQRQPMTRAFVSEARGIFEEQPLQQYQPIFAAYQEVHFRGFHFHLLPAVVQEHLRKKLLTKIAELWQVPVNSIQSSCGKFGSLTLQSGTVTQKCWMHGAFKVPETLVVEQELENIFQAELKDQQQARNLAEEPRIDPDLTDIGIAQGSRGDNGVLNLQYFRVQRGWQGVETYLKGADAGTPSWRLATSGLNMLFLCKNNGCCVVSHVKQFGFQQFFKVKDHQQQSCDNCGGELSLCETEYLLFLRAQWKVLEKQEDDAKIEWESTPSSAHVGMAAPSSKDMYQLLYANPVVCTRPRVHQRPELPCTFKVVCRTGVVLYGDPRKISQSGGAYDLGDEFRVIKLVEDPEIQGLVWAMIERGTPNWVIIEEDGKKHASPLRKA